MQRDWYLNLFTIAPPPLTHFLAKRILPHALPTERMGSIPWVRCVLKFQLCFRQFGLPDLVKLVYFLLQS